MDEFEELEALLKEKTGKPRSCPPLEVILALGQDVLPAELEAECSRHVRECGLCQMMRDDFASLPEKEMSLAERQRIAQRVGIQRTGAKRWMVGAAVAAVAVVVCGVATYAALHRVTRSPSEAVVQPAKAPVAVVGNVARVEKLSPPALALGMTLRGQGESSTEAPAEELAASFEAYDRGDYTAARARFDAVRQRYPKSEVAALYLGVSELLLGKNADAAGALRDAVSLAGPRYKAAADWYLAVAQQRLNDPGAVTRFQAICTGSGEYAAQACGVVGSGGGR